MASSLGNIIKIWGDPTETAVDLANSLQDGMLAYCPFEKVAVWRKDSLTYETIPNVERVLELLSGVALTSVATDETITGDGTDLSPLSAVTPTKIENGTAKAELVQQGDDTALVLTGAELHVGTVADPRESVFGGGDSYPVPYAFHCDIANTTGLVIAGATDVSTIYQSDTGSTAGLLGGTTAGKYLLVGSDYPYQGVKVKLTALGSIDPNNLRLESWRGDGDFFPVSYMATNAENVSLVGTQKGNNICTNLNEQWRFGFDPFVASTWAPLTLNINGVNITKYWGRMVIESPIVTDPTVEQMKCHTDRHENNSDGTGEDFGLARIPKTLVSEIVPNALIDPANENVLYGSLTTAKYVDNEFSANSDDGFLIIQGIDSGVDTSIPLAVRMSYYVKGTFTGKIVFDVDVYQVKDGFVYDGTAVPESYRFEDDVLVDSNLVRRTIIMQVNAEKVSEGEALVISVRRNAVSEVTDTLNASVIRTYASVTGWFWR
jgi:hypothetical protein